MLPVHGMHSSNKKCLGFEFECVSTPIAREQPFPVGKDSNRNPQTFQYAAFVVMFCCSRGMFDCLIV